MVYFARERDFGEPLAEFTFRLERFLLKMGMIAMRLAYLVRVAPLVYGILEPCAVFEFAEASAAANEQTQPWKTKSDSVSSGLKIDGSMLVESPRVEIGLTQETFNQWQDFLENKIQSRGAPMAVCH